MSTSCPGITVCIARGVLVLAGALVLAGCGKSNPTPSATSMSPGRAQSMNEKTLPSDHPQIGATATHPVSGNQLKVITPPEVAAKWKSVVLSIRAPGQAEQRLRVAVGGHQSLASSDVTLNVIAYLPSFKVNGDIVTSSSTDADNPAVLLQLKNPRGKLAEGWVFQKLPEFDTFHSDKVAVTLVEALQSTP